MTQITVAEVRTTEGTPVPDDAVNTFNQCMERAWECAAQSNRTYITWEVLKTVAYIATTDRTYRWALIDAARGGMREETVKGRLRLHKS